MITNKTKNIILSHQELICSTTFSQLRGLMFRPRRNLIMIFKKEKIISLHTFFVWYPIEVLILDGDKKIIEIKRDFKPFTLWNAQKKGKYIVELSTWGNYTVGDALELLPRKTSLHAEKKASAFKPRFFSGVLKIRV